MENVVNLSDRRKKPINLPDNAAEIVDHFLTMYSHMAMDKMPMGEVLDRALATVEDDIKSMPFEEAIKKIESEFPELVCEFRKSLIV